MEDLYGAREPTSSRKVVTW